MASSFPFRLLMCTCIFIIRRSTSGSACFQSIISFGDSTSDTGNAVHLYPLKNLPNFAFPPYGKTFFHRPTGRCSDGRLIVDFIAEKLGLPLLAPFYGWNRSSGDRGFSTGVNFAVAGATAMEDSFFSERGIRISLPNVSLAAQLAQFKGFLSLYCQHSSACKKYLATSLVIVGEIGGNDYTEAFVQGKTETEVMSFILGVIEAIGLAINELINLGATTFMVPGNFPFGCSAFYLTLFKTSNASDYDPETGCIKWLNRFTQRHNEHLQSELQRIRKLHPSATIIYADFYNAGIDLSYSANIYGFTGGALTACCGGGGGGGSYKMNSWTQCGDPSAACCEDPWSYVNWDGIHLTEAAHRWIAGGLLSGVYTAPPFTSLCPSGAGLSYIQ